MNKIQKNIIHKQAQVMRKAARFTKPDRSERKCRNSQYNRLFCDQFSGRVQSLSDFKAAKLFRLHKEYIVADYKCFPVYPGWGLSFWGNAAEHKMLIADFFGHEIPMDSVWRLEYIKQSIQDHRDAKALGL